MTRTTVLGLVALLGPCLAPSCGSSTQVPTRPATHGSTTHPSSVHYVRTVPWAYTGNRGPEAWGELCPDYTTCGEGRRQSPIDLASAVPAAELEVELDYAVVHPSIAHHGHAADLVDNGHTIQLTSGDGGSLRLDGVEFDFRQLHFHAPSEHTLDGQSFPLELHLVHANEQGRLAVLGLFVTVGAHNSAFDPIVEHLPNRRGDERMLTDVPLHLEDLLPRERELFRYSGSLTTPPCTEGVEWAVAVRPVELSEAQIGAFASRLGTTHRPVQARNGRTVRRRVP